MNLRENTRIALQGLSGNMLRSFLTMLGILIGVGSVIVLVAVGNGSSVAVQKQIEGLGTNTLVVFRSRGGFGGAGGGAGGGFAGGGGSRATIGTQSSVSQLTSKDVTALGDKTQAPDLKAIAPVITEASVTATYSGATYTPSQFVGTNADYLTIRNYTVAEGTAFTNQDVTDRNRVALLGQTVVTNLFGSADPIGATVQFNGIDFQVIGVLTPKGSNGLQDQDDIVITPITAVQDTLAGANAPLSQITIEAKSRGAMTDAADEVTSVLLATHHITDPTNADFQVLNQATLLSTAGSTNRVFTVLLGAVAAISLLVGGIGVMNIMLVTVTERTREIGIRKAIGARRSDILGQFLVEAILLSVLGGVVGVVVGLGVSRFRIVGVTPVVAWYSVALAFGVALAVGLFFGLYPANRAASLRPIEALRHE
ncbi:MAG TPA: ABC transporter permease [Acidimicrobiia bacterium]|nr:ABC transporter permease [Acidimicrobiia bacterium]